MNDSLVKLFSYIEPKILDIQDKRIEIKYLEETYQTLKELISSSDISYHDVLNFYDQGFIIRCLKITNDKKINNPDKYKSCSYLLKNNNSNLIELPQYKEAIKYMKTILTYLNELYKKVCIEYENLKNDLIELEILNKYYLLLNKNNIFVEDVEEFLTFLNLVKISDEDKFNILFLVNKFNIKVYITKHDIVIAPDLCLSDINKIIEENKLDIDEKLLNKTNLELDTNILFNKDGQKILLEKKKYLITKIFILFQNKDYENIVKYYQDFQKLNELLKEFKKQEYIYSNEYNKKIIFVRNENDILINQFLKKCSLKYKSCIYKNLLDIENSSQVILPDIKYQGHYYYLKNEFLVKTIYTFLENGIVLVIGIIEKGMSLSQFLKDNIKIINKTMQKIDKFKELNDRDLYLENIKMEDLILTIDLDTLDVGMEE